MPGVVVELGAGLARVGAARFEVAPGDGGALLVDGMTLHPLAFGERARLVTHARLAAREDQLGADVLARSSAGSAGSGRIDRVVLEALALHLAGARSEPHAAPGFSSALIALTSGAGWTPLAASAADADLMDRLSEAVLSGLEADADDGWTRIDLRGTVSASPPSAEPEPAAVRDALIQDLLRRERETPSRAAVALARAAGAAASAGVRDRDDSAVALATPGAGATAMPAVPDRLQTEPWSASPVDPMEILDGSSGETRAPQRSTASASDATMPPMIPGESETPVASSPMPMPIAAGPLWRVDGSPTRHADAARHAHESGGAAGSIISTAEHGRGTLLGMRSPGTPGEQIRARELTPTVDAVVAERWGIDVDRLPLGFELHDLSDAIGAVLADECDVRGLEDA